MQFKNPQDKYLPELYPMLHTHQTFGLGFTSSVKRWLRHTGTVHGSHLFCFAACHLLWATRTQTWHCRASFTAPLILPHPFSFCFQLFSFCYVLKTVNKKVEFNIEVDRALEAEKQILEVWSSASEEVSLTVYVYEYDTVAWSCCCS